MIYIIDNQDSFTYNLVDIFASLGESVCVNTNDEEVLLNLQNCIHEVKAIVLSPGPGSPSQAGISKKIVEIYLGKKPLLGVCLGHQVLCEQLGGTIVRAQQIMHGKVSKILHDGEGLYKNLAQNIVVNRYHSLLVTPESLPPTLKITSWTQDQKGAIAEVMGVRHIKYFAEGVQFHPESILTPTGPAMIQNFLNWIS